MDFNTFLKNTKPAVIPFPTQNTGLKIHAIMDNMFPKVTHFEKGLLKTITGDVFSGTASTITPKGNNVAMRFLNSLITSSDFTNNENGGLSFVKKYIYDNGRKIVEKYSKSGDLLSVYTREANGSFTTKDFVNKVITTFDGSIKKVVKSSL